MFLLDSWIPLVRFSSELTVNCLAHGTADVKDQRKNRETPSEVSSEVDRGTKVQSSEPILFPKLRIYFAEFPYLLSSS